MAKYTLTAATVNKCVERDITSEFTDSALSQLAETAPQKLIFYNFDNEEQVGRVLSAKNDNGELVLEVFIDDAFAVNESDRIVPCFCVESDEWIEMDDTQPHRIIKHAYSVSYGITRTPAEQGLSEIKIPMAI